MSRFLMSSRLFLIRIFFPPDIVSPSRPARPFHTALMNEIAFAVWLVVGGGENLQTKKVRTARGSGRVCRPKDACVSELRPTRYRGRF
jgi:hypothetical protein